MNATQLKNDLKNVYGIYYHYGVYVPSLNHARKSIDAEGAISWFESKMSKVTSKSTRYIEGVITDSELGKIPVVFWFSSEYVAVELKKFKPTKKCTAEQARTFIKYLESEFYELFFNDNFAAKQLELATLKFPEFFQGETHESI